MAAYIVCAGFPIIIDETIVLIDIASTKNLIRLLHSLSFLQNPVFYNKSCCKLVFLITLNCYSVAVT
jgi:hypothetical protein